MSEIQEQILDAVKLLADSAVNQSNATLTIECEIVDIVDAAIGLYKVKYLDNQFEVYCNPSIVYQIGDRVYVLIPDGDFEKTKNIIGAVAPSAEMYVGSEEVDKYVEISNNLLNISNVKIKTYYNKIIINEEARDNEFVIDLSSNNEDNSKFTTLFEDYSKNYNCFLLSAKIKTNIEMDRRNTGNYGIKLSIPVKEDQGDGEPVPAYKDYILDVNNIQGNPYGLTEFALQDLYIDWTEDIKLDLGENRQPYITFFVKDFTTLGEKNLPVDIWINDISFKAVDVLTTEQLNGYHLTLVSTEGNYFINTYSNPTKILTPILKVNGKNKKLNGYECYWFVEDSSINMTSDDYFAIGGLGWKCLNPKINIDYNEEGKMTYQYVTDIYNLEVNEANVKSSLRYKCILIKDSIVVSGNILLKNLSSNIQIKLISATGYSSFVKNTGYINLIASITKGSEEEDIEIAWQRYNKDGDYLDSDFYEIVKLNEEQIDKDKKTWLNTEIKFPCSLVEDANIVNCTFYSVKTKEKERVIDDTVYNYVDVIKTNLGTASIMVTTSEDFVYKLIIQNGDVLYKYDAYGNSPMVADYDGPLSSRISAIQPLSFKIYKADGTEFNETEYAYCDVTWRIPVDSMIKLKTNYDPDLEDGEYHYITGVGNSIKVNYNILNSYNAKKNNNSVFLTVKFQDTILTEIANIKFIKDGAAGTNGSKYAAIITYQDKGYSEIDERGLPHKFHPVFIAQNSSSNIWNLCDPNYIIGGNNSNSNILQWNDMFNENAKFGIKIYKDGVDLSEAERKNNIVVNWSIFDANMTKPAFKVIDSSGDEKNPTGLECYICQKGEGFPLNKESAVTLQAKVTIKEKDKNTDEILYTYYPIEMTYIGTNVTNTQVVPELLDGFNEVLYASDGTNPKYDNTNPFSYGDNLVGYDITDSLQYTWTTGGNLENKGNPKKQVQEKEGDHIIIKEVDDKTKCIVRPISKYDNGISLNYVKVQTDMPEEKYNNIKNVLNPQNDSNLEQSEKDLNNYKAIKGKAEAFIESFNKNDLEENIENSKSLLKYRGSMINYINTMIEALQNLSAFCSKAHISTNDFDCHYTETKTILYAQQRILYILGTQDVNLDSLIDLSNLGYTLTKQQINKIKKTYGVAAWETLKIYINEFNTALGVNIIIDGSINNGGAIISINKESVMSENNKSLIEFKYMGNWNLIKKEVNGEKAFTALVKLFNDIKNDENLNSLIDTYKVQDYINLKNQLIGYIDKLTSVGSDTYFYDKIYNDVISPCEDWFNIHNQTYYNNQLQNSIDEEQKKYDEYKSLKAQYTAILNVPLYQLEQEYVKRIIHIKPIIMILNRYEMSSLNGWDGNKLYTDPNNDEYLFAPQIGAGKKNEDNSFTGVVMGVKNFARSSNNPKIGLFGYSSGVQSLFLNAEDGSATFGRSGGGQIIIDPNSQIGNKYVGLLYSYDFWNSYNSEGKPSNYSENNYGNSGMLIDLSTPQIIFGSRKFKVTSEGELYAQGGGSIAGWKIGSNDLSSPNYTNNKGIRLDAGNSVIYIKGQRNSQGTIVNTSITINANDRAEIYSGSHNAIDNTNNGFYLSENGLSIGSKAYISSTGTLRLGNGAVKNNSKHWTIDSGGEESYIGYNATSACINYDGDEISGISGANSSSVYLGTDGIRLGQYFAVSPKGYIWAEKLKLQNGAKIGDWTIEGGKLVGENDGGQIVLNAKGAISGGNGTKTWSISRTGDASFNSITINGVQSGSTFGGMGYSGGVTYGTFAGASTYSSNVQVASDGSTGPFGGTCGTQIEKLAVKQITAENLEALFANITVLTVKCKMHVESNLVVDGGVMAPGLYVGSGTEYETVATQEWCRQNFVAK